MIRPVLLAAAFALAAPLSAQTVDTPGAVSTTEEVKVGRTLRDANNARLGRIDRVNADGSVRIIFDTRFVTIPADTISVSGDTPTTSLSRRDVARIR